MFTPVSPHSFEARVGALWGFPAFTIALGSSYFRRLLAALPRLRAVAAGVPSLAADVAAAGGLPRGVQARRWASACGASHRMRARHAAVPPHARARALGAAKARADGRRAPPPRPCARAAARAAAARGGRHRGVAARDAVHVHRPCRQGRRPGARRGALALGESLALSCRPLALQAVGAGCCAARRKGRGRADGLTRRADATTRAPLPKPRSLRATCCVLCCQS